jgi:hypothetical protein
MLIWYLERFKHLFPLIASGQFNGLVPATRCCSPFMFEFVVILCLQSIPYFVLS